MPRSHAGIDANRADRYWLGSDRPNSEHGCELYLKSVPRVVRARDVGSDARASRPRVQRIASTMAPPPPHAESAPLRSGRTGDLDGNLNRVKRELRRIRFPVDFDAGAARQGSPMALLPALHYAMLGFSRHVTSSLVEAGHDLRAKSDARFVENAWRALREAFGYNPALTVSQFLSPGFAERKLMLLHDAIELCKRRTTNTRGGSADARRPRPRVAGAAASPASRGPAKRLSKSEKRTSRRDARTIDRSITRRARARRDASIAVAARARARDEPFTPVAPVPTPSGRARPSRHHQRTKSSAEIADEQTALEGRVAPGVLVRDPPRSASTRFGGSGGRLGGGGRRSRPSPPRGGRARSARERPGTRTARRSRGLRRSGDSRTRTRRAGGRRRMPFDDGGAFDARGGGGARRRARMKTSPEDGDAAVFAVDVRRRRRAAG